MTEEIKCEICDRNFKDSEGLAMHNKAKHPEKVPKERKPLPVKKMRNWGIFVLIIGFIILGIYFFVQGVLPKGDDFSVAIPVLPSREHISPGTLSLSDYNSNPPTSGDHYDMPARPGFRETSIEDGHLIHSLEHGLILVSYHPRIGDEAEKLRSIVNSLTVVVPREKNEWDISIASWGRLDSFNLEDGTIDADDLQRIKDFVKRYANKGPESIPAGQHNGV